MNCLAQDRSDKIAKPKTAIATVVSHTAIVSSETT